VALALKTASELPRARSLTILSDCLAYVPVLEDAETARRFFERFGFGTIICVDIGRYRLSTSHGVFDIMNSKLVKMWPDVANTPTEYDAKAEVRRIIDQWQLSTGLFSCPRLNMAFASQISLRLWVGLFSNVLFAADKEWAMLDDPDSPDLPLWRDLVNFNTTVRHSLQANSLLDGVPHIDLPLCELGPKHNSQQLEWITEVLAMNIETFSQPAGLFRPPQDAKACWPELENGESLVVVAARAAAVERARVDAWYRDNYITIPIGETRAIDKDAFKDTLLAHKRIMQMLGLSDQVLRDAGVENLRKVLHLMVAMMMRPLLGDDGHEDHGKQQELDEWSHWS